ncbi:MAG: NAD(P)H-hydrate dehydratase [Lachnospiraceae bacterium]|nr:NAD(P)H-hydrate dehydratase [Lachnospiraceae bacterium]
MKRIVTAEQMKSMDRYTIEQIGLPSVLLMERAALAIVAELEEQYDLKRVLVVCGSGNNGGDGIAIARILHCKGVCAEICEAGNPAHKTKETIFQGDVAEKYQVPLVNNPQWHEYTTIVDAIFGVGLSRTITGNYETVIREINHSGIPVCAVDIPSGIHAGTGQIMGCAIQAKSTVTFAFSKAGLLLYPGAAMAGTCITADIGIYEPEGLSFQPEIHVLEAADPEVLLQRKTDGNKGTFGKAFLIAGSGDIFGAAYLSAMACMRSGAGMIKILTAEENRENLQRLIPEAMLLTYKEKDDTEPLIRQGLEWADVVAAGPGIGQSAQSEDMVRTLLEISRKPLVLDADALNLIGLHPEWLESCQASCILTPHMGEMARLTGLPVAEIKKDPIGVAGRFAAERNVQCVLKDARTCTADVDGSIYINMTGNDGMATAGSGDVLTGMILSLLCQGVPAVKAGALGAYLHGKAGDKAREKLGTASMLARDIITAIPEVYEEIKHGKIQ